MPAASGLDLVGSVHFVGYLWEPKARIGSRRTHPPSGRTSSVGRAGHKLTGQARRNDLYYLSSMSFVRSAPVGADRTNERGFLLVLIA